MWNTGAVLSLLWTTTLECQDKIEELNEPMEFKKQLQSGAQLLYPHVGLTEQEI